MVCSALVDVVLIGFGIKVRILFTFVKSMYESTLVFEWLVGTWDARIMPLTVGVVLVFAVL